jgi:hypothetical protein
MDSEEYAAPSSGLESAEQASKQQAKIFPPVSPNFSFVAEEKTNVSVDSWSFQ